MSIEKRAGPKGNTRYLARYRDRGNKSRSKSFKDLAGAKLFLAEMELAKRPNLDEPVDLTVFFPQKEGDAGDFISIGIHALMGAAVEATSGKEQQAQLLFSCATSLSLIAQVLANQFPLPPFTDDELEDDQ